MWQRRERETGLLASTPSHALEFRHSRMLVGAGSRVCRNGHRLVILIVLVLVSFGLVQAQVTAVDFSREVERSLPIEELYDHHKQLSKGPVHSPRRQFRREAGSRGNGLAGAGMDVGLEQAQLTGAGKRRSGFSGLPSDIDAGAG